MISTWVVLAEYPVGLGDLSKPAGDEPVTRAKMLSATSCGTTYSTFTASVEAETEEEATREAMVAIARQAAWRSVFVEPKAIRTRIAEHQLATQ